MHNVSLCELKKLRVYIQYVCVSLPRRAHVACTELEVFVRMRIEFLDCVVWSCSCQLSVTCVSPLVCTVYGCVYNTKYVCMCSLSQGWFGPHE